MRLIERGLGLQTGFIRFDYKKKETNSVASSPQANYTDWATATCWRNLVPTFADRGVSRGQRGGSPTVVNLSFLDRSRYVFFQVAPHLSSGGWVDPVPDLLLLWKSGSARNRTRDLWVCSQEVWTLDHRGGLASITVTTNYNHLKYLLLQPALALDFLWDQLFWNCHSSWLELSLHLDLWFSLSPEPKWSQKDLKKGFF
jgi:hypothetical protein